MKETFQVIHAAELDSFLARLDVLEALKSGQLTCEGCGTVMTLGNFRAVSRQEGNLVFLCSNEECLLRGNRKEGPNDARNPG